MAVYGAFNFTGFSGVNLKNTAAIRFGQSGSDVAGTLSVKSDDESARSWVLPAKSGALPIAGTVAIQFSAAQAAAFFSTIVTVSGIRVEDMVSAQISFPSGAYDPDNSTFYIMQGATARNGSILLHFFNPGNATGYTEAVVNYVAMR